MFTLVGRDLLIDLLSFIEKSPISPKIRFFSIDLLYVCEIFNRRFPLCHRAVNIYKSS